MSRPRTRTIVITLAPLLIVASLVAIYFLTRPPALVRAAESIVRQAERGRAVEVAEIEQRFGTSYERDFAGWDRAYHLGDDGSFFAIDSRWLVIRLNPQTGRVIDAAVIVD
ncbi:MAG: hypothetical protein RIE32_10735 [Phycisphaerales bacterium]